MGVQKACKSWLHGKEGTMVEMLLKSEGVVAMRKRICKKACGKRREELPKLTTWNDEPFTLVPEKYSHKQTISFSPGDLEILAAQEKYEKQRRAERPASPDL